MDPQPNIFSTAPPENPSLPPVISSGQPPRRPRFHKKTTIAAVILILVIVGAGGGYAWYQGQQDFLRDQKLRQAQAEADRKAALERQGTVEEIEAGFKADSAKETDEDSHLIFTAGDSLQREATSASAVGENNATSL